MAAAPRASKFYQLTLPNDKNSRADPAPFPVTLLLGPITTSHLYRDDHIVYTSMARRWARTSISDGQSRLPK